MPEDGREVKAPSGTQAQGSLEEGKQRLQACEFPQLAISTRSMLGSAEVWLSVLPGSERASSGGRVSHLLLYSNGSVCRVTKQPPETRRPGSRFCGPWVE